MTTKKEKAKAKAKARTKEQEEEDRKAGRLYADSAEDDEDEGEWFDEDEEGEVTPQAVPPAALVRTSTVTTANPTPPTNVPVVYQGTPPTQPGLAVAQAPAPLVTDAGIVLFADPLNGAVARSAVLLATVPATTPAAELAGRAEGDGSESVSYWPVPGTTTAANATDAARGVGPGVYTEKPNADHPSYGT
jgi:hypothetical protein